MRPTRHFPEPMRPSPGTDAGQTIRNRFQHRLLHRRCHRHFHTRMHSQSQTRKPLRSDRFYRVPAHRSFIGRIDGQLKSLPEPIVPGVPEPAPVSATRQIHKSYRRGTQTRTGLGQKIRSLRPKSVIWPRLAEHLLAFVVILGFVSLFLLLVGFLMNSCAS